MQKFRVLVIEDNQIDVEAAVRALRSSRDVEFGVDHVCTLSNAFDRAAKHDYDVILLDLGLPDGLELDGLSKLVSRLDVPVVVLTGNEDRALVRQAFACGAQDYVEKSENRNLLLSRTVQFAIYRHRAQKHRAQSEGLAVV